MKIMKSLAVAAICGLAAAGSVRAQAKPKEYVNLLTAHVKPDGVFVYEAYAKKVMAAAAKINYGPKVNAFQVTSGGAGFTYMFVTYFDTWEEADGILSAQAILEKALGAAEAEKVLGAGRATVESTQMEVFRLLPSLNTKPKAYDPPPAYLQIYRTEVKPSMMKEWESVIGRYREASDKFPAAPTAMRRVVVEGKAGTYITSSPYNTGAERDTWPTFTEVLEKVYGAEEARNLDARRAACVEQAQAFVLKHRPDLSYAGK